MDFVGKKGVINREIRRRSVVGNWQEKLLNSSGLFKMLISYAKLWDELLKSFRTFQKLCFCFSSCQYSFVSSA